MAPNDLAIVLHQISSGGIFVASLIIKAIYSAHYDTRSDTIVSFITSQLENISLHLADADQTISAACTEELERVLDYAWRISPPSDQPGSQMAPRGEEAGPKGRGALSKRWGSGELQYQQERAGLILGITHAF